MRARWGYIGIGLPRRQTFKGELTRLHEWVYRSTVWRVLGALQGSSWSVGVKLMLHGLPLEVIVTYLSVTGR